jgi:hypothetical protein
MVGICISMKICLCKVLVMHALMVMVSFGCVKYDSACLRPTPLLRELSSAESQPYHFLFYIKKKEPLNKAPCHNLFCVFSRQSKS